MGRAAHIALVAAGAALFVALVRAIGIDVLTAALGALGPAFLGVVALELVLDACNTRGWSRTLASSRVGFWRLFWVRQAGTAVNQLTPTASLGGEVVKAVLLGPEVGADDALASIIAAKLSFAMAQAVLVLLGLATALGRLHGSPALLSALVLAAALTCAGIGGFFLLQRRGLVATLTRWLGRLALQPAWLERLRARGTQLDARLAALHRERPAAFAASVAWHLVAQLVGALQLFCVLRWIGAPATLITCIALEALALVIDSALFFVPGRIGVQEGGRIVAFTALGLSAATGLAVAVVGRLNQLTVAAIGLAAFAYFSLASAPASGSPSVT